MIKIISVNSERELHIDYYALVSDLIKGSNLSMPCGGKGVCLKCKVTVEGQTNPLTELEKRTLSHDELEKGVRLACQTKIKSGTVVIDDNFHYIGLTKGIFSNTESKNNNWEYAVAVDIGTTTVAAYLYDFKKGEIIKELCENNMLVSYGADVMSRIEYCMKNSVLEMSRILANQIEKIINTLLEDNEGKIVVTGNTVMLNIYAGNSVSDMGCYPYTPKSLFGSEITVKGRTIYIPKCVSAFIGADITCAIAASRIFENKKAILIDIGTNGEIALKQGEEIICTSVAAGPAFEGVGIKMGLGGINGAVSKVFAQGINLKYKTIGNIEPKGICGSGIIDFVAVLKKYNALSESGEIKLSGHPFSHLVEEKDGETRIYLSNSNVCITNKDIRNIQVAKSAVISGINTLMKTCNVSFDEIECLYISGGFGNFIDVNNACNIGLIPSELEDKVKLIGNGALSGALMACINPGIVNTTEKYKVLELADNNFFNEEFIKNMRI